MKYLLFLLLLCTTVSAAPWKTYKDARLGIEFQHPPEWKCEWHEDKQILMVMPDITHPPYVAFQTRPKNPNNLPIETWYKTTQRQHAGAKKGELAGQPAMIIPSTRGDAQNLVYEIARPGGQIFAVATRLIPNEPTGKPISEKILKSFRFTK